MHMQHVDLGCSAVLFVLAFMVALCGLLDLNGAFDRVGESAKQPELVQFLGHLCTYAYTQTGYWCCLLLLCPQGCLQSIPAQNGHWSDSRLLVVCCWGNATLGLQWGTRAVCVSEGPQQEAVAVLMLLRSS